MKDSPERNVSTFQGKPRAFLGEISNADDPLRFERRDHPAQVFVTSRK